MKIIVDVDLGDNAKEYSAEKIDTFNISPGCLLIEDLPTEKQPLGPIETVALTWEQRSRPRRKCVTNTGSELSLALPRGTVLSTEMLIFNTTEKSIKVVAAPEDVLILKPADQKEMCLIAHHLGNWHRSLQLNENGTLLVEPDSPLLKWLQHQNISHEKMCLPYHPNMKGAAHD
jgi:urease accessory protein UreE